MLLFQCAYIQVNVTFFLHTIVCTFYNRKLRQSLLKAIKFNSLSNFFFCQSMTYVYPLQASITFFCQAAAKPFTGIFDSQSLPS